MRYQADKLQTLIKAANLDDVEPIWTTLFAKVNNLTVFRRSTRRGHGLTKAQALEGKDVKDMLLNVGSGGGAAAAPSGAAAGGASGDAPAEAKEEEKKEEGISTTPCRTLRDRARC
jgi:ribosomal protein L12E/L44/L45/RPP1/RPP2